MTKNNTNVGRIKEYFECVHCSKKRIGGISIYGVNMNERISVLRHWLDSSHDKTILDIGCGDGSLVAASISGVPARIRLEDIVQYKLNGAVKLLEGRATYVDGVVTDIFAVEDRDKYDIVLMIGVTDYYSDWERLVIKALERAKSILIVDFPKASTFRMKIRKIWLYLHGISVYGASRRDLEKFIMSAFPHYSCSIKEATYNWMVKFKID